MKKVLSVLLALALLTLTLCASAEEQDIPVLLISDLVVSENGETLADFTGLGLQLAAAVKPDCSEAQLFFDLLSKGETVNSAMLQIDKTAVVGLLGGMSSAYGVSLAQLTDRVPVPDAQFNFPEDLLNLFGESILSEDSVTVGDPEKRPGPDGEELSYTKITGDLTADFLSFLEKLLALPQIRNELGDDVQEIMDELKKSNVSIRVEGEFGVNETGDKCDFTGDLTLGDDYTDFLLRISAFFADNCLNGTLTLTESGKDVLSCTLDARLTDSAVAATLLLTSFSDAESPETLTVKLNGILAEDALQGTLKMDLTNRYGYEPLLNASLFYVKDAASHNGELTVQDGENDLIDLTFSKTDGNLTAELRCEDYYGASSFTANAAYTAESGEFVLSVLNDGSELTATWQPCGDETGHLTVALKDDYSTEQIELNVSTAQTRLDTDRFHIAGFVDLLALSEQESAKAMSEVSRILSDMLRTLTGQYESLAEIFGTVQ